MTAKVKTGGRWDPTAPPIYFKATELADFRTLLGQGTDAAFLVALNAVKYNDTDVLEELAESGISIFLDSGVFDLTNRHARKYNVSMDEALLLAPEDIAGFDKLFERYCSIVTRLGDKLWGYTEIDQGGVVNKRKIRAKLESFGFRPIPVYHPLNDGWDYFDELAGRYDRMCFGNLVQANKYVRSRLLLTAHMRARQYPDVWIHALGVTPNHTAPGMPLNSYDSSAWLAGVRWACGPTVAGHCRPMGPIAARYNPRDPKNYASGRVKSIRLGAYNAEFLQRGLRNVVARVGD